MKKAFYFLAFVLLLSCNNGTPEAVPTDQDHTRNNDTLGHTQDSLRRDTVDTR